MNSEVGPLVYQVPRTADDGKRKYSGKTSRLIDVEAQKLIAECFVKASKYVQDNVENVSKVANKLFEKEVLNAEDLEAILGPRVAQSSAPHAVPMPV